MLLEALGDLAGAGIGAVRKDYERKRVHNVAVQQDIQLHELRGNKSLELVIIARVTLCP